MVLTGWRVSCAGGEAGGRRIGCIVGGEGAERVGGFGKELLGEREGFGDGQSGVWDVRGGRSGGVDAGLGAGGRGVGMRGGGGGGVASRTWNVGAEGVVVC